MSLFIEWEILNVTPKLYDNVYIYNTVVQLYHKVGEGGTFVHLNRNIKNQKIKKKKDFLSILVFFILLFFFIYLFPLIIVIK
jgi:hypothetical protein